MTWFGLLVGHHRHSNTCQSLPICCRVDVECSGKLWGCLAVLGGHGGTTSDHEQWDQFRSSSAMDTLDTLCLQTPPNTPTTFHSTLRKPCNVSWWCGVMLRSQWWRVSGPNYDRWVKHIRWGDRGKIDKMDLNNFWLTFDPSNHRHRAPLDELPTHWHWFGGSSMKSPASKARFLCFPPK